MCSLMAWQTGAVLTTQPFPDVSVTLLILTDKDALVRLSQHFVSSISLVVILHGI